MRPRIVIDLGGLDGLWPGAGLFRYVVDLVHAVHALRAPADFVVFGSVSEPIPEIRPLFGPGRPDWSYRAVRRPTRYAAELRRQCGIAAAVASAGADLYHCLHTFVPIPCPCPTVVTIQDLMYELFPEYRAAVRSRPYRLLRWGARVRARRIICPSGATAEDLGRIWGIPADRIDVVHHGLRAFGADSPESEARPENAALAGLGEARVIASPLNLEPRKNLVTLLEAYARLPYLHDGARLVLFGKGGWTEERAKRYRADLARLGIEGLVVEPGVLSDHDLRWLYRRATVFAFPTLYEGFGYPALEAMAAGTCTLVRDASSMAELVGDAGVRLEPFTPSDLAAKLSELLADDALRAALGRAAAVRAASFTAERMARQTLDSYRRALGRPTTLDGAFP
ncbi:glycosyltransferase family 4 protein (plasmid) [Tundrisphaera sp. TA3]|uniref:glycosyltransferase family 4 protein n=1 Tax=Tundrisphaera sp. TA3 TaxID=3435775 RepID=UPI003EBEFEA4